MILKRLTFPLLFAAAPLLALTLVLPSACILDDDFIKEQMTYPCTNNSDCSEPGFTCQNNFCSSGTVREECVDLDGDGYGTNNDRVNCLYPELDKDDTCAACTPVADEYCDGFDNDTNGEIDEPISCVSNLECPQPPNAPSGALVRCENSQCVLVPPLRSSDECKTATVPCVNGAYDDTSARTNGCFG